MKERRAREEKSQRHLLKTDSMTSISDLEVSEATQTVETRCRGNSVEILTEGFSINCCERNTKHEETSVRVPVSGSSFHQVSHFTLNKLLQDTTRTYFHKNKTTNWSVLKPLTDVASSSSW